MRSSIASVAVVTLGLSLFVGRRDVSSQTATQAADPVAEALARPISPGSVALLLPHGHQPAVIARLTQALADPRAEVRAVAARLAFTTRHQSLAAALTAALEREQSPVAGAEIVRALTLIKATGGDAAIRAALPRFDSRATVAWAETVARARPGDLWGQLADLPNAEPLGNLLFDAAVAQPDAAAAAFANLRSTPALQPVYQAVLRHASTASKLPPLKVVTAGLDTPGPPRQDAALLLAILLAAEALPAEAAGVARDLPAAADLAWMPVYAELARRREQPKTPPRALVAALEKIDEANMPASFPELAVTAQFDKAEAAAFRRVAGADWQPPELPKGAVPAPVKLAAAALTGASEPAKVGTRLARPMSVALLRDLETLLGCSPASGQAAVIDVQYRPTGQVRTVSRALGGPPGCLQLASIVASLEVAPGAARPADEYVDRLVIGLRPSDLSCERYTAVLEVQPTRPSGRITAPRKLRNVEPVYAQPLQKQGIQGLVIVEATIATSGCVADAKVLRGVHPGLDTATIAAVSEWLYEPMRVDGKPAPLVMTVTMNFRLP